MDWLIEAPILLRHAYRFDNVKRDRVNILPRKAWVNTLAPLASTSRPKIVFTMGLRTGARSRSPTGAIG